MRMNWFKNNTPHFNFCFFFHNPTNFVLPFQQVITQNNHKMQNYASAYQPIEAPFRIT